MSSYLNIFKWVDNKGGETFDVWSKNRMFTYFQLETKFKDIKKETAFMFFCVISDILEQIHTQYKLADEKEAEEDIGEEKGKRIR